MDVQVTGLKETQDKLVAAGRHLPFAISYALTLTAAETRDGLRENLKKHFTIRNKWVARGMRSTKATPKNLSAEVGSKDPFMPAQAHGGIKEGNKSLGIPFGARPTKETRITKSTRPAGLLKKKGYHLGPYSGAGPARTAIWFEKKGEATKLMYLFQKRVRVPKRWPFAAEVYTFSKKVFEKNVDVAIGCALATAHFKGRWNKDPKEAERRAAAMLAKNAMGRD